MRTWIVKASFLLVVLSMLLAACATPTTAPTATQVVAAATSAPTVKPTTVPATATKAPVMTDIELWVNASVTEAGPPPDDWAAYKIIKEKLNINLKIVFIPSGTDGTTKRNAAAAANNLPDSLLVDRDTLYKWVQAGLVAPVESLLPLMPERTKQRYSDPVMNKLVTFDGKMFGLPEPPTLPMVEGLVIRKDWLDKLSLKVPTTLDEVTAVMKAFTEKDPDGNGKNDTYGFGAFIENNGVGTRFDWIFGGYGVAGMWKLNDTANFGLNVRDPNYVKGIEYIKKMVDAKVIDPDWPTLKKDEFRARWKQGKYGMIWEQFCALACTANYTDFDKNYPGAEWVVVPAPKGPDGKSAYGANIKTGNIYAVSKKAFDAGKGPAIAKLFEWMTSKEGYMLLGFGQENINYKLDKDGGVVTVDVDPKLAYTAKEMQPLTQLRNLVYYNSALELKIRYVPFKTASGRTQDPLAYLKAFGEQPWVDATGAGVINPPASAADFYRFYSEHLVKSALGQKPLDAKTWAEYITGLEGMGLKDWEANAKKALLAAGFIK